MTLPKLLISFLSLLSMISCVQQSDSINGHWHRFFPEYGDFSTLDINDSLTLPNYYNLGRISNVLPRTYQSKNIIPVDEMTYTESYFIKDDTLVIKKDSLVYKYIRSNIRECVFKHRYIKSLIAIELPNDESALSFDEIPKNNCASNIFVGKLKKGNGHFSDSLLTSFPDSIFIQANSVFIKLHDLPTYSVQVKDMCSQKDALIYLHLDKCVSVDFTKRILSNIPNSLNLTLYRTVKMSDGDIGIKKLEKLNELRKQQNSP